MYALWLLKKLPGIALMALLGLTCAAQAQAQTQAQSPQSPASPAAPVILTVGESTTAGYGVPRGKSWPAQLQALLTAEGLHYKVVNHGRSGSTTTMALNNLTPGLALQPHFVVIALGGNDRSMNFSREQTKQTLRRIIQMCLAIDAKVFLADRAATTDNDTPSTPSLYAELAAEEGVTLIPALNEGVAGDASLLLSDMQHPNADGYAIIAARMLKVLGPALRSDAR